MRRRHWLLAILVLQTIVCGLRIFLILDIMGGFIMSIMIGMGWYAWKEDMHITFAACWGILCAVNGVFDALKFIDLAVHATAPVVGHKCFYYAFFATEFAIPVVSLLGCIMAWNLWTDYEAQPDLPSSGGWAAVAGSRSFSGEGRPLMAGRATDSSREHAANRPAPFSGKGHKLDV